MHSKSKCSVLLFLFTITAFVGLIGCSTVVNHADLPSSSYNERLSPDKAVENLQATNTVNVTFMVRGYCYAGSNVEDTKALGGFGRSGNMPKPILSDAAKSSGECYLLAQPNVVMRFREKDGMRLLLVNSTKKTVSFNASDSRLDIIQEAKDKSGKWKPIEYLPSSMCGNSYHRVFLRPGEYWAFPTPRYEGEHRTQLRFCIRDNRGNVLLASNEFHGSINQEQFSNKQPYNLGSPMPPKNQIPPEKDMTQRPDDNRIVFPNRARSALERVREKRLAEREVGRKENVKVTDCLLQKFKNNELGMEAVSKLQLEGISPLRLQLSNEDGMYELWVRSESEQLSKTILKERKVIKLVTVDDVFEASQFIARISSSGIKVTAQNEIGINRDNRKSTIVVFQKDQKKALEAIEGFTPKPLPARPIHPSKNIEGFKHL